MKKKTSNLIVRDCARSPSCIAKHVQSIRSGSAFAVTATLPAMRHAARSVKQLSTINQFYRLFPSMGVLFWFS
ncbi:hypothetical protein Y032_0221g2579 [Ancylostoma ceylanicum]|uniref:Uncharacterized protein n=1 Tax=Ancylostoma ceylanicum TaxID=53326 RepID=A0A016SI97_9BILA|nr:hypothetical protein Y032_0221g2579 [Ancylostoma ceylanicum]